MRNKNNTYGIINLFLFGMIIMGAIQMFMLSRILKPTPPSPYIGWECWTRMDQLQITALCEKWGIEITYHDCSEYISIDSTAQADN